MNRLKEIRKQRGYVLQKLTVLSGVSTATLNTIEKHDYLPRAETQQRLATALGVEVTQIWPSTPAEAN